MRITELFDILIVGYFEWEMFFVFWFYKVKM